jgi:hypothetical protein
MARGTAQEAKQNAGAGASQNAAYAGRASDVYNSLFPQLQNQAANGLPMADQAALNTASQQSLGGSQAGAVGAGNLMAARTRNAGGATAAIAESARSGERQNSQNALGTVGKNIAAKQMALQAMQGLYGENANAGNNALQGSNSAIAQQNQADANTMAWTKMFVDAASNVGAAGLGA